MQLSPDYQVRMGTHIPGENQFKVFEDEYSQQAIEEREWFSGSLLNGASVRVLLRGTMRTAELDQLIQMLSAERSKLE